MYRHAIGIDPSDIDHMGHVNNSVYLKWVQEAVVRYWEGVAPAEAVARHLWVALKHEIEFRRPTFLEDVVVADVIAERVQGAKALFTDRDPPRRGRAGRSEEHLVLPRRDLASPGAAGQGRGQPLRGRLKSVASAGEARQGAAMRPTEHPSAADPDRSRRADGQGDRGRGRGRQEFCDRSRSWGCPRRFLGSRSTWRARSSERVRAAVPILIGTTGLDDLASRRIEDASRSVAVLRASNTSLGVALLEELVERAARGAGLAVGYRGAGNASSPEARRAVRHGAQPGRGGSARAGRADADEDGAERPQLEREEGAIGFASLRGGTVVGDHDVIFAGTEERLILSHRADSRMIFARGALAAARFLAGQKPGLYPMRDVVGAL